jgi:murein DD-endopeptidase MepM/ murein hydrolase activator NlpD
VASSDVRPFGTPQRHSGNYGEQAALTPASTRVEAPSASRGDMIEVHQGDTLYSLSQRHGVSVGELMSANGLSTPDVKVGQRLVLPSGASSSGYAAERAVEAATPARAPLTPASAEVVARYNGSYMVRPGDSLYGIARAHGVKASELQRVNGISDVRSIKPGVVLRVPRLAPSSQVANVVPPLAATHQSSTAPDASAAPDEPQQQYGNSTSRQPTIINSERRVASLNNNRANDANPAPQARIEAPSKPEARAAEPEEKVAIAAPTGKLDLGTGIKFRWPAVGKVIAGFGGRTDGTHNDGINVSVPLGTDVHAAEDGVVAYAGNELKGYGNLILIRHDNDWVTAYAHNDQLLVKRGDKVKRGQVIAKAGSTGSVDRPQIHFELRKGSKPVDPIPYMEKL